MPPPTVTPARVAATDAAATAPAAQRRPADGPQAAAGRQDERELRRPLEARRREGGSEILGAARERAAGTAAAEMGVQERGLEL